jgi:hypothetical protein
LTAIDYAEQSNNEEIKQIFFSVISADAKGHVGNVSGSEQKHLSDMENMQSKTNLTIKTVPQSRPASAHHKSAAKSDRIEFMENQDQDEDIKDDTIKSVGKP